jgi:hypothetical protein
MRIRIELWDFELDIENNKLYYISMIDQTKSLVPAHRNNGITWSSEYIAAEDKAKKLLRFRIQLQQVLT